MKTTNKASLALPERLRGRALTVGVDLDGVLYRFLERLALWLREHGNPDATIENWDAHWHGYEGWGITQDEFVAACVDAANAGHLFLSQDPDPEAVASLHRLRAAGHVIIIITARGFGREDAGSRRNTREWLAKHDVPFDALFFDRDKTSVRTDVFIEDNLENYAALEGAGTFATLVAQPWNVDDPRDLNRVSSVTEFVDMILAQG